MGLYSRALRHVDNKDFRRTHQHRVNEQEILCAEERKKRIVEEREIKKIKKLSAPFKYNWREKLNEGMTSSGVFFATLPATGDANLTYPSWNALGGYNYNISGGTATITNSGVEGPESGIAASFDTSLYDTLVIDVGFSGDTILGVFYSGSADPLLITTNSGTYNIKVPQSKNQALVFLSATLSVGTVNISNLRFQRRTPLNVLVSLDNPEASAFIRTDPIMANLSPQERMQKLKEMLEASDEYVMKILGSDFPGTGAVPPGEIGDIPGVQITNVPYQQPTTFTMGYDVVTDAGTQKATYTGTLKTDSGYQKELSAYEKAIAANKQKSDQLSKDVAASRAEYLKPGQTVAQRQQSYNRLQAAIKAGTDHAVSTLKNPIIKPTPPKTQTTQSKFTPQQLANIDKQIKDLQAQSEKNKQDAINNRWKAAAELGLGVAGVVGGVGALAKIPAAIRAAKTVSQVRQATKIYNTQKALDTVRKAADVKRITSPGTYTAKPNPSRTPVKGGMMYKNSYEPEGEVLVEKKKLKSPQEVLNKIPGYYDGKPAPLGFPETPPPEMVNGMHPDLVDGKNVANRFNRLDPESAKAMPPTGNPHIDKKVKAARKKPK